MVELFFQKSHTTPNKEWLREDLGNGRFRITKTGIRCPECSEREGKDCYRSIRVEYQRFTDKFGETTQSFAWLNSKCGCLTVVIYKNGRVVFLPSKWYARKVRIFDDLKNIPSSIEVHLK